MKKKEFNFIIYSPFPHYTGGIETWLFNVSNSLANKNYKVNIFSYKDNTLEKSFVIKNDNITIYRIGILRSNNFLRKFIRSYLIIVDDIIFSLRMSIAINKKIKKNSTIISLGPIVSCLPVILNNIFYKRYKLICSVRGFHAKIITNRFKKLKILWYWLEEISFKKSDCIWCNGQDTLKYVINKGYQATLMPNGVDFKKYNKGNNSYLNFQEVDNLFNNSRSVYIVSTATLLKIKGVNELIKCLPKVAEHSKKKFKVIWVGKGNKDKYIKFAKELGVDNYIEFIGERKDTAPYLKLADIILCLSGGGGISMALLETMASAKPIIAWNNNVYRQLLKHNISGILVPNKNSDKLADALIDLINNYNSYKHLGKEASRISKEYDWENIVKKVIYLSNF